MRGLSEEERKSKYDSISSDVRKRIYQSYPKNNIDSSQVNNKKINIFYNELFEFVGEFDLEYILANLFFESNFTNISYYLKNNSSHFNYIIKPPFEAYTFKWLIHLYLEEDDFFQSNLIIFLKNIIKRHVEKLLLNFEVPIANNFQFDHIYPKWLINSLIESEMQSKTLFLHLLVIKLYNIERNFIDNTNAIILLNNLSEDYEQFVSKGEIPNLYDFSNHVNKFIDKLFIKNLIIKTPILDSSVSDKYSNGYYINREKFYKKIQESEILNSDFLNKSYSFQFEVFLSSRDVIQQKIKKIIKNKIINFIYPTNDDIKKLKQLIMQEESIQIENLFFNKLYMY